jgi:hypothetical protein
MTKREIPEIDEEVDQIRYIGPYLRRALNDEGIRTCGDLVDVLEEFGEEWEGTAVRRRVKEWLELVLMNARALECCHSTRILEGEECAYKARFANQKGFNAVVKVMRHYAPSTYRKWVPYPYRGLSLRNKYPRECRLDAEFE